MSAINPVPQPELLDKSATTGDAFSLEGILRLTYWALWCPQCLNHSLQRSGEHDDGRDGKQPDAEKDTQIRGSLLLLQSNLAAMFAAYVLSAILSTWYMIWLPDTYEFGAQIGLVIVATALSLIVALAFSSLASSWGLDRAVPSLAVGFALLTASGVYPLLLRMWSDMAWLPQADIVSLVLFATTLGIMANLAWIVHRNQAPTLVETLALDGLCGYIVFFLIWLISWIANEPIQLEETWPLFAASIVFAVLACHLATLRPMDWLIGFLRTETDYEEGIWHVPHVTPLTVQSVERQLESWLDLNFADGLSVAMRLWLQTLQHSAVKTAVCSVLDSQDTEECMKNVLNLYEKRATLPLQSFVPELVRGKSVAKKSAKLTPKQERQRRIDKRRDLRPVRKNLAVSSKVGWMIAGCWYLERKYPDLAHEAFKKVGTSPLASEMVAISEALDFFWHGEELTADANRVLPVPPTKPVRKDTWAAIEELNAVLNNFWASRNSKDGCNRKQSAQTVQTRLDELLKNTAIPMPESLTIKAIAEEWCKQLEVLNDAGRDVNGTASQAMAPKKLKPIAPPFVFATPISSRALYMGRGKQLDEFVQTVTTANPHNVLITGSKFIGKSSFLQIAQNMVADKANMIIVDLRRLPTASSAIEQFTSELCQQLGREISPTSTSDLNRIPSSFYLRCVECIDSQFSSSSRRRLVIAVDHLDSTIGVAPNRNYLPLLAELLGRLRDRFPDIVFVFASTVPPELLRESDLATLLVGSHDILLVRFDKKETRKLLHHARSSLRPKYEDAAIDEVQDWTGGHPALEQMLAYYVSKDYNQDLVGDGHDPVILKDDVTRTQDDGEYSSACVAYCTRMLDSARRDVPNFQPILDAIPKDSIGIDEMELWKSVKSAFPPPNSIEDLREQLRRLAQHDIVEIKKNGSTRYVIPIRAISRNVVSFLLVLSPSPTPRPAGGSCVPTPRPTASSSAIGQ